MIKQCVSCGGDFEQEYFPGGYYSQTMDGLTCNSTCWQVRRRGQYEQFLSSCHQINARKRGQTFEIKIARRLYMARWKKRHPNYHRELYANDPKYRARNRIHAHLRRARKNDLPATFTAEQWEQSLNYFNGCCAVCGRQLNSLFGDYKAHQDHWIPVSYEGDDNPGTVATNMIPLCKPCNLSKAASMPEDWLAQNFSKRKSRDILARVQTYFNSVKEGNHD